MFAGLIAIVGSSHLGVRLEFGSPGVQGSLGLFGLSSSRSGFRSSRHLCHWGSVVPGFMTS